ncbi:DUF6993 domain-containing protein [Leifsonia virtsii]|uniref:DUF6993 domain-containing protein n=1 Tax=Leifsonia virtsii TaxID=3035915 RepID=A0ABT8IUA8_9MICO|nr:hypothetical protein [Leifsonia virtsii]MDN4596394.1 hypothetical protein [Leifsonia virtsii]
MPSPVVRRTGPLARVTAGPAAAAAAVLLAFALTGCVGGTTSTASPTGSATSSATATPTPSAPAAIALVPGGTAQQNLPYFDQVNRATLAAKPDAQGRDFIDALVAAGFSKADMQVTVDTTTIGLKANSIQFSVKLGDTCLIGQNGADAGGYNSMVTPVLSTGSCLIGQTRPIDW